MAKRKFLMTDAELITKLSQKVKDGTGWPGTTIARDNERTISYYNSALPKRQSKGRSSYISSDVYDAVEQMKAQLIETFAAGREIIRFNPNNTDDPGDTNQARLETKYVDHVVFTVNKGFEIFYDVIHDGLMARKGVAQVEWDEDYAYDTQTFDGIGLDEAMALASDPEISDFEGDLDEATQTYSGQYTTKINKSRVLIEAVPPEEYFVEKGVKCREDGLRGRRRKVTKSHLLKMGYPMEKIKRIKWDETLSFAPEKQAREAPTGDLSGLMDDPIQPEQDGVELIEVYVELVMYKGENQATLWRVRYAGDVLLEKDPVEEDPYVEFNPLRIPHTTWGNSYAGRVIQTQNARTVLTRGILDHTSITLNPRWQVVTGGLANPKEMLDQRLGGLVNVSRPDAITPLLYGNLNPFVYQTLEMLKQNKEEQTGISALSQGLNKDAVSKQNSDAMIDNLITVSQIRQKVMARFFAYSFLMPLYQKVWKTVVKYENKESVIEVVGKDIPVNPANWKKYPRTCWLSPHLGYGEAEKEAANYSSLYDGLSKDPAAAQFFGPQQRYKLLGDAIEKRGIYSWRDYIAPPDQWQPPPPDPIETKKADAAMTQAQASLLSAQATVKKVDIGEQREVLRTQNDTAKTLSGVQKQYADTERQNLETVNRVDVEQRKMALEEHMRPKEHETNLKGMQGGEEA